MFVTRAICAAVSPVFCLALLLWSGVGCTTVSLTSARSPGPVPTIDRLLVVVRNHHSEREGRRVRRAVERALEHRKIRSLCVFLEKDADPGWVNAVIDDFKPTGILAIQLVGIVGVWRQNQRAQTQYDASLSLTAAPERRIWRGKAVASEGFDAEPEDRSDKIGARIVEELVSCGLLRGQD